MINTAPAESLPKPEGHRINLGSIVIMIGVVVMGIIVGIQLVRQQATQPTSGPAPDFELTTFEGNTFRLSDLRGSIVVLNFWASWCDPCRDEAPILQNIWEEYRDDGVVLVGVAYADATRKSLAYIEEFGITYPNGPDIGTRISDDYHITGVPETFVIDPSGNVVAAIIAPIVPGQLEGILDELVSD